MSRDVKFAKNLCGTDIGAEITYQETVLGRWDADTRTWPDKITRPTRSTITMITHKKNGDVSVRVFPVRSDLLFSENTEVELTR